MIWTDETVAAVKKMWGEGHSCSVIGRLFGITRSAVIGKMHRMGYRRNGPDIPMRDGAKWTPDMDARLRVLADEGASRTTMAVDLGLTYNQVLSRCRVLRLKVKDGRTFVMAPFSAGGGNGSVMSRRNHELGTVGAPARIVNEEPDPNVKGLTCVEMPARGACRWPVSGTGAAMLHCGQSCGDVTYCVVHAKIAFIPQVMAAARAQRHLERSVRRYS